MEEYVIRFQKPGGVHFIGIGGISMSGLAKILHHKGFCVSGSDVRESDITKELSLLGMAVHYGHREENIPVKTEAVVYTAAVKEDNPEFQEALRRGIPLLSRARLLGQLMGDYNAAVAISGTHGKTTCTSMLSSILLEADADPTITVGGVLPSIGGNLRIGSGEVFLTEACEYTNSFLDFFPTISVILNIEEDHLDFFKDLDEIRESFRRFVKKLPPDGTLVIHEGIPNREEIYEGFEGRVILFGGEKGDIRADTPDPIQEGGSSIRMRIFGEETAEIRLQVPGIHNIHNALGAAGAAFALGIDTKTIARGLSSYTGVNRRFEKKGSLGGIQIVDDYAHHPREIASTLAAARQLDPRRIVCVFQPHTYTRTRFFRREFAEALSGADLVVLSPIYAAREPFDPEVRSRDILVLLQEAGKEAYLFDSFDEIEDFLLETLREGDLCITMGAGDIVKIGESLLGK